MFAEKKVGRSLALRSPHANFLGRRQKHRCEHRYTLSRPAYQSELAEMALTMRNPAVKASSRVAPSSRRALRVACQAQKNETASKVGTALAASALAAAVSLSAPSAAMADIAGLTPCSESKAYAKLEKKELKTLEKRLKQVNILTGVSGFQGKRYGDPPIQLADSLLARAVRGGQRPRRGPEGHHGAHQGPLRQLR